MTRSIDGSIRKAGIKSALLFIALLCSVSGSATTYYVNDNDGENYYSSGPGSNMNYGTINAPFSSISTALTYCFSGDTVLVDPGTYNENIIISVAVTILGPNTGIPGYHQSNRNPEAIINSPYIRAIEIHSGICTISGFTITNTQDLSNERYMIKAGNFFTNGNNITRLNFTDNILRKYHTAPGGFALMIQDNSGISRQISIVDNLIDSTTSVSGGIAVWVSGIDNTISRNRLNTLNYDAINLSASSGNLRAEITQNYI
ncbi:MAG: hypothetical protein RL021_1038, partial [Bacteroidota bacterium]